MTTMVLVHGAFHGPWCFDRVVDELRERGITTHTPELPLTSLEADAAVVTSCLDQLDGPVLLLGHSYGGAVVTVAGNHPNVAHVVLLAALAPDDGEGGSGGPVDIGEAFLVTLQASDDGRAQVDPARAAAIFYPDATPEEATAAAAKLRPGATGLPHERVVRAAWRDRPTTYVVCADDPIVLPHAQRALAARTGATVVEIPGDHSPFFARAGQLADILAGIDY